MAFNLADRVRETTTTTGTGAIALGGALPGYRAFSDSVSVGDTFWYAIVNANPTPIEFEIGVGTLTAAATLTRSSVLTSSNANATVTFSAGTKEVLITFPADIAEMIPGLAPKNNPVFTGLAEIPGVKRTVGAKGNSGTTAQTFDATATSAFTLTNTGAHSWSFVWPAGYSEFSVLVANAGANAITFPAGIRWRKADGTYSTTFADMGVTLQAAAPNEFMFWSYDGGTTVYGRAA